MEKLQFKKGNIIKFKNGKKMIFVGENKAIEFNDNDIHDISKTIVECNGIDNIKANLFSNVIVYSEKDRPRSKLNFDKNNIDSLKALIDSGFVSLIKEGNDWMFFSGKILRDTITTVAFEKVERFRKEFGKLKDGEYKLKDIIKWAENDKKK